MDVKVPAAADDGNPLIVAMLQRVSPENLLIAYWGGQFRTTRHTKRFKRFIYWEQYMCEFCCRLRYVKSHTVYKLCDPCNDKHARVRASEDLLRILHEETKMTDDTEAKVTDIMHRLASLKDLQTRKQRLRESYLTKYLNDDPKIRLGSIPNEDDNDMEDVDDRDGGDDDNDDGDDDNDDGDDDGDDNDEGDDDNDDGDDKDGGGGGVKREPSVKKEPDVKAPLRRIRKYSELSDEEISAHQPTRSQPVLSDDDASEPPHKRMRV